MLLASPTLPKCRAGSWVGIELKSIRPSDARAALIAREFIPDVARLAHTQIIGTTGCGKTVLLEQMLLKTLHGLGAIIIDPKGDRRFTNACGVLPLHCHEDDLFALGHAT